jgi:hypothetical protein
LEFSAAPRQSDRAAAEKVDETEACFRAEIAAKEQNMENLQSIHAIIQQAATVHHFFLGE